MTETREMRESQLANLSASRDYATFKVKEEEFSLDREAEHVSLNCSFAPGVEAIDRNRHVGIREALGFALGQFIHPFAFDLVRVTGERVRVLRAPAQSIYPTREKLPIHPSGAILRKIPATMSSRPRIANKGRMSEPKYSLEF